MAVDQYYVYIMTNRSRTLYTGVTNDLLRRVFEHKQKRISGFTTKYNISRLVYFETTPDVRSAIAREKQITGWLRSKRIALIEATNPDGATSVVNGLQREILRFAQDDSVMFERSSSSERRPAGV